VDAAAPVVLEISSVPLVEDPPLLVRAQDPDVLDPDRGLGRGCPQEALELGVHPLDGLVVEQVGRVLPERRHLAAVLDHLHHDVESGNAGVDRCQDRLHLQAGHVGQAAAEGVEREEGLKDGGMVRAPLRPDGVDQHLEW